MERDITGVILVGGKSRRMGTDKAFIEVGGRTLFETALETFAQAFPSILLVGDRPERFTSYHLPIMPDIFPGSSLGGLYTGLYHAGTDHIFVSSCDLPFPNLDILRYLCSLKEGYDAVVPVTPRGYEPLFALYSKNCLAPIKRLLESGECCAFAYYPELNIRYVPAGELERFDAGGTAFLNLNTPEEVGKLTL